jgi:hypothetical protein
LRIAEAKNSRKRTLARSPAAITRAGAAIPPDTTGKALSHCCFVSGVLTFSSSVRAFEFIEGCPEIVVPDNLKSGVHKPSFYDPLINRTYGAMAAHYSITVLPARSGKPRDKGLNSYCTSCAT